MEGLVPWSSSELEESVQNRIGSLERKKDEGTVYSLSNPLM